MKCKNPDHDNYPYYGLAPHVHELGYHKGKKTICISTKILKKHWPKNYEDTDDGAGVWHCPDCYKKKVKE